MRALINDPPLKSDHNKDDDNDVDDGKYDDGDDDDEEYNVDDGKYDDSDNDDDEYNDVDYGNDDDNDVNDDDNLPPLPPEINVDGMSKYEIRQVRKIHRNEARLKSLGLGNDGEGKHSSKVHKTSKVRKTSMRVKPGDGLYYPDDDAFEADVFNEDYDDKYCSSIPAEAACDRNCNRIMGGPQLPENASKANYRHYKAERKAYTDSARPLI